MARPGPFTEEELTPIPDDFYSSGATIARNVFPRGKCQRIYKRVDHIFDEPYFAEMRNVKVNPHHGGNAPIVVQRLFECDRLFRDLLVREPIISIAEAVLGPHCRCMAQGCILNRKDFGINHFHIDDSLEFPMTNDHIKYHDRSLRMPVFRMSFQIALTDQDQEQYGPSQFVPGSHYAGRQPNDLENPTL